MGGHQKCGRPNVQPKTMKTLSGSILVGLSNAYAERQPGSFSEIVPLR